MGISRNQLILPLLEAISSAGSRAATPGLYDVVAESLSVSGEDRRRTIVLGGDRPYEVNVFERDVRWAQQTAKLMGLAEPVSKPYWRLTGKGRDSLREALPGVVITVFTTKKGIALFGSCEAAVGYLDDASVNLIFTSPPYPLSFPRQYGNVSADQYCDWFLRIAETWPRIMARDGSIVLNLGDVCEAGSPNVSLYQERLLIKLRDQLGLNLCQKFYWQSTSKLPVPKTWVAIRRVRVKPSIEQLFWLSPSANPFADNKQVLKPYSDRMLRILAQGGERRREVHPSGHDLRFGAYGTDNGGAIPGNLLSFASAEKNRGYVAACRANGLPVHPARFPMELPSFFIRFLTREGDLVFDPMGGSSVTGEAAEKLGRRWITSDLMLDYVLGARHRFPDAEVHREASAFALN